jgi:hypothetical protein
VPGTLTVGTAITGNGSYTILATAQNTCMAGIVSGQRCTLPVQFSPNSIATHRDFLTLTPSAAGLNSTRVELLGSVSGLSVLGGVSGESLSFGSVSSGSTRVLLLTVTNVGLPGPVTVDSAITVRATPRPTTTYKILTTSQNTCLAGVAAGQSCVLPVEFAPTSSGVHDDLLTLTPSAGDGSTRVWLTGSTP